MAGGWQLADVSLATVAVSLREMLVSPTQHTDLTVYPAPWFVMISFGSLCFWFIPTEKLYLFKTGNLAFMFTTKIYSHLTVL